MGLENECLINWDITVFQLDFRGSMWFQLNGALPYFSYEVRQFLIDHFQRSWMERGGRIMWPPRSHDLNPLGFFFGASLKQESTRGNSIIRKSHEIIPVIKKT